MDIKKRLALALSLLILLSQVLACSPPLPSEEDQPLPSKSQAVKPSEGEALYAKTLASPGQPLKNLSNVDLSDAFRQSLWTFASRTSASALKTDSAGNSLYSPVSLYYALAMLEAGAAGDTKAQLIDFLEAGKMDPGPELRTLYALMANAREGSVEQIANALWVKEELLSDPEQALNPAWLDQMANHFYASAFAVDFSDPKTAQTMSRWVEDQTQGKIKPEIDTKDPLLLLVLMNTLYFKAEWAERFDPDKLSEPFYPEGGQTAEAAYLTRFMKQRTATRTDRFSALSIQLKNGSVDFILPAQGLTPESLLADPDFLSDFRQRDQDTLFDVDFKLPVFQYRDKIDVLDKMADLGLAAAVTDKPDFSAMYTGEIWVSGISQETFIALNENGIEAAAYTEVHMCGAMPPQERELIEIHLNRPFIYVISDQAGAPLFVGIIRNPAVTN